jgi:hypothetical protein
MKIKKINAKYRKCGLVALTSLEEAANCLEEVRASHGLGERYLTFAVVSS